MKLRDYENRLVRDSYDRMFAEDFINRTGRTKSVRREERRERKRKRKHKGKPRVNQDYNEYIKSPEWRAFRIKIFAERGRKCQRCGSEDKKERHVHHVTYIRFRRERPEDVQVLCKPCHEAIHRAAGPNAFRKR